ncbi:hypothetical protein ACV34Z_35185, partial [Pseudomonas aeruginosa]
DTSAAEFATDTAYMYSTYEEECEANPSSREKIMILGGAGIDALVDRQYLQLVAMAAQVLRGDAEQLGQA